jgi:hypothetical protein
MLNEVGLKLLTRSLGIPENQEPAVSKIDSHNRQSEIGDQREVQRWERTVPPMGPLWKAKIDLMPLSYTIPDLWRPIRTEGLKCFRRSR